MCTTIPDQKAALRRAIRRLEAELSPEKKAAGDARLLRRLTDLPEFAAANTLLLFAGVGAEPDTAGLLEHLLSTHKRVALPRVLPEGRMECRLVASSGSLAPNRWGIPEPAESAPVLPKEEIELALIPALCYDTQGFRLGHGGGYYDRWLPDYRGLRVGLCRDAFLQQSVPRQEHDQPIHILLTESGIFHF